jgi:hypothetical protein
LLQALKKRQEHQQASWVCFLDLVRAFDTVNRQLLFDVASKMGVTPALSQPVDSLAHRRQGPMGR